MTMYIKLQIAPYVFTIYNNIMKLNISHIAKLANLPLTDKEQKKFEKQLGETVEYIDHLNEINTNGVLPTNNVTGLTNVLREDKAQSSLSQEEALRNTKSKHNGLFKVSAIFED